MYKTLKGHLSKIEPHFTSFKLNSRKTVFHSYVRGILLSISSGLLLASCANAPINVQFKASNLLNLDTAQRSLPVTVRLYQLSNTDTFAQATFWELWKNDKTTLGDSLLSRREVTVIPDQTLTVRLDRQPRAHYLGVFAIFRRPKNQGWRIIRTLSIANPLLSFNLKIEISGEKMSVS